MMVEDVDLFSKAFKRDPFPTWAALREHAPVHEHVAPYGARIWYVTQYDDVLAVLRDNQRFTKNPRWETAVAHAPTGFGGNLSQMISQNMLFADPPDHTRLRALVGQAFTPRRVEALAPRVQAIAEELLERVRPHGRLEAIADFALPLPMLVIMELLGIPTADQSQVHEWSKAIIAPSRYGISLRQRRRNIRAFVEYVREVLAARQTRPQDDLITALVQAEEAGGDKLTETELTSMIALLFVTGHETVVNLIGNGLLALLTHPAQMAQLQAQPALLERAMEELLRFDGPVETSTTRWAREDVVLGGQAIRRGDVVRVVLASANRDAAVFAGADGLDFGRAENPHLAFGYGIHYCLGAPLARLEGRIAFPLLLGLPNLRLAIPPSELKWQAGVIFRGLEALPLVFGG
jgi:cytochrome P450